MEPPNTLLRSVHTTSFPGILTQLGISLLVTTYQAGKLIVVRADGEQLNTHFRVFQKPMGLAVEGSKLAIGSAYQIWELGNIPALAQKLDPPGKHDACFIPRHTHITGDIDIHEMAYGAEGLWFLNTRFSCLCTVDASHSFVPRWRPPFVTAYDLSDRCHLNGLALVEGIPRFVTALGQTDTPGGWRSNKANGGILMEMVSNEILLKGLSMPHSPRWYQNQLWVLESGQGCLARVDPLAGTWQPVAQVPGFTRGLDFFGPLAFIGLSKVRESAVFSGIPITQRLTERICGVWVVHIETGQTVAFLRFEEGVEEIFAVQVLSGIRFPEVVGDPRFADPEQEKLLGSTYVLPDQALQQVAAPVPLPLFREGSTDHDPEPVVTTFAVVVPNFDAEARGWPVVERTLASIRHSIHYCQQHYSYAERIQFEIVIVEDGSTDRSWELLEQWAKGQEGIRLVRHGQNRGKSAARNTGVEATRAQALFFCDHDDLFLDTHILTGVKLLNRPLNPNTATPIFRLPGTYPAAVKTGIRLADPVHPYWYEQIRQVHTLNLCVRREAHQFIEGFPIDEPFQKSIFGAEDQAYCHWLTSFFSILWSADPTVEYIRYPGNHLDQQMRRFQSPPGTYQEPISAEQQGYLDQIQLIIQQRQHYLQQKFDREFNPDRLLALGNACHEQGQLPDAARYFQRCLDLDPQLRVARYNMGVTCADLERWPEAELHLSICIAQDPLNARAYNSLGFTYANQNRLTEAITQYQEAIRLEPNFADAHMNLGMALLKLGQLKQGWEEFEWRWQTGQFTPFRCPQPRWHREDIRDQTLLLHTEQGAGDAIQFIRFIPLAAERCRRIILVCPDHLMRLFAGISGVDRVYPAGEIPESEFQVYSPLMSLPRCLEITSLDAIPRPKSYLPTPDIPLHLRLKPNPKIRSKGLKSQRDSASVSLNLGICWAGSPTQGNDHNRSTHLRDWLPILSLNGIRFHSLQKGPQVAELQGLPPNIEIKNWDLALQDYADTAALIAQLDGVITVDTSVAHLAGALGKPTWVLLCHNCDWRWLLDREDSPYYPTLRLFRQQHPKEWAGVMQRVKKALQEEGIRP